MSDSRQDDLRTVMVVAPASAGRAELRLALLDYARNVLTAEDVWEALRVLTQSPAELAIVCEDVAAAEALSFVEQARVGSPETRVVVTARRPSVKWAVDFVRAGARDYLPGPLLGERLGELVSGVRQELASSNGGPRRLFCRACPPGVPMVGRSEGMEECLETIRLVSESRCNPILLLGQTGTGKELAARAVHAWRCGDPERFVAVNCAALTANLLESELFGHVKGAFTGADRDKTGLFELAGSGTILLDEISEMPLALQAKLLRVLQERTFRRVGGTKDLVCSATIIASSNRDLLADVKDGKFRKDLYYRLAVFPITLPPLASDKRRADIPLLASYFIEASGVASRGDIQGLTPAAEQILLAHDWQGNVRELRNVIDRAMILERSDRITPGSIRLDRPEEAHQPPPARSPKDFSLETAEIEFIERALKETGWQRTRAAALLGITRATLHAKLKRYGIQAPDARSAAAAQAAQAAAPAEEKLEPAAT